MIAGRGARVTTTRIARCIAIGSIVLAAILSATAGVRAHDESKYPDWSGEWVRGKGPGGAWDPTKRPGLAQQAPLTPEYQAILEAGLRDLKEGGNGINPTTNCIPPGMPRSMIVFEGMEFVIAPKVTHVMLEFLSEHRRIYTDGRGWPKEIEPTFSGYSIGEWIDSDGDGRYDTLAVETRGLKGPRTFDGSIPMHRDNQTVVKERIFADKDKPDILLNEVTTSDHALTRPWTVTRTYRRLPQPAWLEYPCGENNEHVFINHQSYLLSADGFLMPTKKGQPPPDLRYFQPAQ
jgi:hypothetical protein